MSAAQTYGDPQAKITSTVFREKTMTRAFISYSHADEQFRAELQKQLTLLKRQGLLDVWNDHRIPIGGEFEEHISAELEAAEIILLLVSADFLASEYCYGVELKRAMERHDAGAAVVVPIIIRPCDWESAPFGKLKVLPKDGKPVTKWATLDDAYLDVVQSLREYVTSLAPNKSRKESSPEQSSELGVAASVSAPRPRSSTLAFRKEFRDIDRDAFFDEGFAFIRNFFENSLQEVELRNPDYEGKFRLRAEQAFTGAIYHNGKKVAGCYIRATTAFGMSRQIGYSGTDDERDNGFNETLSVDADDQSMFFKALMGGWSGGSGKLTHEGAAEKLWQQFIDRLT